MTAKPSFIIASADVPEVEGHYPRTDEVFSYGRAIGKAAGLQRIGLHIERLPPGHRLSYPHAEEKEEEFVYVIEGEVDAWIDGHLHHMRAGDLAAFPAGTGICHTFINNGDRQALLLGGGERTKSDNRIFYPLDQDRRGDMPWVEWWQDIPLGPQGPHDGKPDRKPR